MFWNRKWYDWFFIKLIIRKGGIVDVGEGKNICKCKVFEGVRGEIIKNLWDWGDFIYCD